MGRILGRRSEPPLRPERGEVKALGWHGERPTGTEEARHADWLHRQRQKRQQEIERRVRLLRAELERETPL